VALNSNQVKSPQAGVHACGGGLYLIVRESGDPVWAFRFTDVDGKRAQMEFARIGNRSVAGDVLTSSSARNKAREYKVALSAMASIRDSETIARRREALQAWADFIKPRKNTSRDQPPERTRPKLMLVA
jgi:hypothetical protein